MCDRLARVGSEDISKRAAAKKLDTTHRPIPECIEERREMYALDAAEELGAESLVIPALGCGVAGFDLRVGAQIICEVLANLDPDSLSDMHFIAYADDEYEAARVVADEVR